MILTGPAIEKHIALGEIVIDPYDKNLVGPNSVDLRLHHEMKVYGQERFRGEEEHGEIVHPTWDDPLDIKGTYDAHDLVIPNHGYVLYPGILYLARTVERIGSNHFVPMVEGRSSVGRLGLQIHMTAGFCDTGFFGTITLEMSVVHPLRIYPNVAIAQVFFVRPEGQIRLYEGRYQGHVDATPSRMHLQSEGAGRKVIE